MHILLFSDLCIPRGEHNLCTQRFSPSEKRIEENKPTIEVMNASEAPLSSSCIACFAWTMLSEAKLPLALRFF